MGIIVSLVLVVVVIMTVTFGYMRRCKATLGQHKTEQEYCYNYVMERINEKVGESNTVTVTIETKVNE